MDSSHFIGHCYLINDGSQNFDISCWSYIKTAAGEYKELSIEKIRLLITSDNSLSLKLK